MAELLVGPVIEKLIDTGFQYLKNQVRWQTGMKEELERLRKNYPQIQAVVGYASSQEQIKDTNPALNEWLWRLRDAIDEADAVMDEFEYLKLKKQLTKTMKQRKVRSTMKYVNEKLVQVVKRALKIDPTLKRLEEVVHKLDEVSAGVTTFLQLAKEAKQDNQELQLEFYEARETGSSRTNDLMGRGKEKEDVMKWLRNPSNDSQTSNYSPTTLYSNISLLSVVGQGGIGKTTLLQDIYKEEMKIDFDLKLWVCVSNNFNVTKVIADMLESLTNERPHLQTLNVLQKNLESEVKNKKFLLVLDDIWEEEEEDEELNKNKWEKVLAPLASGKLGSKILLTTRMKSVAVFLSKVINKKEEIFQLEGLQDDKCLLLLYRYAFANVENPNAYHNLMSIAQKMVNKLYGSPLAAVVIGGVLNSSLKEDHWRNVLNYVGSQNGILNILKSSYIFLPKVLRNCLSLCCIFPQDYQFHKDDLVRMWIALGFIQLPTIPGDTMKDVGERYFDTLIKKSLIDKFQVIDKTYYKLHDLLQEMLRRASAREYLSIVGDEELLLKAPETIRHLFVKTNNPDVHKKMEKLKNLRSIILFIDFRNSYEDLVGVLAKIFKNLRNIRLMYIYVDGKIQIPKEVGDLIHLRYLKVVNHFPHFQLPISLSNLYYLQFMIFDTDPYSMVYLPKNMNNLPNLHYLKLPFPGMYEIGKLNSLKELDGFYVQNGAGYRLEELEHMNELSLLRINNLRIVEDDKDACNAKLCNKEHLRDLSLVWHIDEPSYYNNDLEEKVLDKLEPCRSLEKLNICSFMGVRSAIWMNNVHLISKLEYIKLENCLHWQILPPFWQLPFLQSLYLVNMPEVKGFEFTYHGNDKVRVFPSLQVLYIKRLLALKDWFFATAASYECLFPCLIELHLEECPNLQELSSFPPKLEKLEIDNIGWKGFNWLEGITSYCNISIQRCPNVTYLRKHSEVKTTENCQLILREFVINDPSLLLMAPLTNVTSIQKLGIEYNHEMISFPIEAEQWFLQVSSSLCELNFYCLSSLLSLPSYFESLSSLKILHMKYLPRLQLLSNMPVSLEQLKLDELHSLQSLPSSLKSLSSLKILHVKHISQLQLLSNMPASLEELVLINLESLKSLPSSLESHSSLKILHVESVPLIQLLPNMPPSLKKLTLIHLESLQSLPSSLDSLPSLKILRMKEIPLLQQLPNMPASLKTLDLTSLQSLQCLPSSVPFFSLKVLYLISIPLLQKLPDLPPSLDEVVIDGCYPELKKRYERFPTCPTRYRDWE